MARGTYMTEPALALIIVICFLAGVLLFILVTDGRYFGKRLMYRVYDRLGPTIFAVRHEKGRWRELARQIGLSGEERSLDVGTALGDLPLTLATMPGFRGDFVGVDWSPSMMAAAKTRTESRLEKHVTFIVADMRQGLPLAAGAFDLVLCLGLLETLPRPGQALGELVRVAAPGGRLVLSLYRGRAALVGGLSRKWYERHLAAHECQIEAVLPFRSHHDVLLVRRN